MVRYEHESTLRGGLMNASNADFGNLNSDVEVLSPDRTQLSSRRRARLIQFLRCPTAYTARSGWMISRSLYVMPGGIY